MMYLNSDDHSSVSHLINSKRMEAISHVPNEPRHDKTNKMSVRPAKTDQPGHLPSLIRVFDVHSVGS